MQLPRPRTEQEVKWGRPTMFRVSVNQNVYQGHLFPILHPDHYRNSKTMGRYELVVVWYVAPGLPHGVRSFYFKDFESFAKSMFEGLFMVEEGAWLPVTDSPLTQKYPHLLSPTWTGIEAEDEDWESDGVQKHAAALEEV